MEGYKFRAENADIVSCDCSTIESAHIEDGNLLLKIDQFLYTDEAQRLPYPCKEDCLLILENFALIDEKANSSLVPLERRIELEHYITDKGLHLYISFEEFLRSSSIEVQSFIFDWEHQQVTIDGYDTDEEFALWCSLKFRFGRIMTYWNMERVW